MSTTAWEGGPENDDFLVGSTYNGLADKPPVNRVRARRKKQTKPLLKEKGKRNHPKKNSIGPGRGFIKKVGKIRGRFHLIGHIEGKKNKPHQTKKRDFIEDERQIP